jgi:hypothetical protein
MMRCITSFAIVMNALSTLMFDFADVSKNLTCQARLVRAAVRTATGVGQGRGAAQAHLILIRKQLPPRVFHLS